MNSAPKLVITKDTHQSTRVDLMMDEKSISRLWLSRFTLHIGVAQVEMDGVGGVGTDEAHRSKGHSRRVLEAAVEHMRQGDAALSMLYGIRDFYPKFGYATAGPDHIAVLTDLQRDSALPPGWSIRALAVEDLPAVHALYALGTAGSTGAIVRDPGCAAWARLDKAARGAKDDACRVVANGEGAVRGYIWRAPWCWYVRHALEPEFKRALVIAEVMADSPAAADAVLAACRRWAGEQPAGKKIREAALAFAPDGPIAAAAMRQDARLARNFSACGGSMARVLDVRRLLEALRPELMARLHTASASFTGSLSIQTDIGAATLRIARKRVAVVEGAARDAELTVSLPQYELARLALGAFPPEDVLARLPEPPEADAARILCALFPLRHAHMHLPDRY